MDSSTVVDTLQNCIDDLEQLKDTVEGNDLVDYPVEPLLNKIGDAITALEEALE